MWGLAARLIRRSTDDAESDGDENRGMTIFLATIAIAAAAIAVLLRKKRR
jgi:hypothetical protein